MSASKKNVAIHKQWAYQAEIQRSIDSNITLLECLAFNGPYSDVIDFTNANRGIMVEKFNLALPLVETLGRLSFVRTSDASAKAKVQNCQLPQPDLPGVHQNSIFCVAVEGPQNSNMSSTKSPPVN